MMNESLLFGAVTFDQQFLSPPPPQEKVNCSPLTKSMNILQIESAGGGGGG